MRSQLDLTLQSEEGGDISNFNTNGEWDLLGMAFVTYSHDFCYRSPFFLFLSRGTYHFLSVAALCIYRMYSMPPVVAKSYSIG